MVPVFWFSEQAYTKKGQWEELYHKAVDEGTVCEEQQQKKNLTRELLPHANHPCKSSQSRDCSQVPLVPSGCDYLWEILLPEFA